MPEAACGGVKNVLAICEQDTKISKVAQQRGPLLLRFKTEDEVSLLISGCQLSSVSRHDCQPQMEHPVEGGKVQQKRVSCTLVNGHSGSKHVHTQQAQLAVQLEEWDKQLHRSQQNMRALAGSDPNTVLDTDFDVESSELDTQSEAATEARGRHACLCITTEVSRLCYWAGYLTAYLQLLLGAHSP